MEIPVLTQEVFQILKPLLPPGTYMSSAYRSAEDQLRVIRELVCQYNAENPKAPISFPAHVSVDAPQTWLPALVKLRKRYAVNAPVAAGGIRPSPHSADRVVFDLSHKAGTARKLEEIKAGCLLAEARRLMGFNQIKVEPRQNAVHVDVAWVSHRSQTELWVAQDFATI